MSLSIKSVLLRFILFYEIIFTDRLKCILFIVRMTHHDVEY